LADLSLITLNRAKTARCQMSDRGNDSYVPGTPVERIALVWPLTREVSSLSKRYDAERRLQRHVAHLVRREGIEVHIPSLDDLVTNKKASGRTKDLADVEALESLKDPEPPQSG
jgi:hypothetical protein